MSRSRLIAWGHLLIIAAVAAVFGRSVTFDFIAFDDRMMVADNPHVHAAFSAPSLHWAFTTFSTGNWYPLTWLSHMIDWRLFGDWAGGHHLINVIFHAANAMLLFTLLHRMTGATRRSWAVAMLFAVHPLAVESVAWISERKNTLSTMFWLLTTLAYLGYVRRPAFGRYLLVLLLFTLGLTAKSMLVTLPCTLLLLDAWPLRRLGFGEPGRVGPDTPNVGRHPHPKISGPTRPGSLILEKLPLLLIAAAFSILTLQSQSSQDAVTHIDDLPLAQRFATTVVGYGLYLSNLIYPVDLAPMYPHPALVGERAGWPTGQIAVSIVVLLALTIITSRDTRHRYLLVGWLWFLGTLFPVSGIIQVGAHSIADRYTYVPMIGLAVAVVWGAADLVRHRPPWRLAATVGLFVILAALAVAAFIQTGRWRNTMTLFNHTLAVTDDNAMAHYMVASELMAAGDYGRAQPHLERAVAIWPDHPRAHNALGVVHFRRNDAQAAIHHWQRAVKADPTKVEPYMNLGDIHLSRNDAARAVEFYLAALERMPDNWTNPAQRRAADTAAWLIATRGLPGYPPDLAVNLAQNNLQTTDPQSYATYAAALAHAGRFDPALQAIDRAASLATSPAQRAQFMAYRQRFAAGKPLRFNTVK